MIPRCQLPSPRLIRISSRDAGAAGRGRSGIADQRCHFWVQFALGLIDGDSASACAARSAIVALQARFSAIAASYRARSIRALGLLNRARRQAAAASGMLGHGVSLGWSAIHCCVADIFLLIRRLPCDAGCRPARSIFFLSGAFFFYPTASSFLLTESLSVGGTL
jgi:hypothetical protein